MASRAYKQDLPPKGGYASINFKRIPARTVLTGKTLLGGYIVYQIGALWYYKQARQELKDLRTENRGAHLALLPMLQAERDRSYLRFLKVQRDAETDLMADVDGWEVGTFFGHKVFKTLPDELLPHYFASASHQSIELRAHFQANYDGFSREYDEHSYHFL